jgi:Fe-S cluster assembly iron-binding protein IscA
MLAVTERAKEELKRMLSAKADNPQAGLRLVPSSPGTWALIIDIEMPDDQVIEYEGSKVLLVEQALAASLEGVTLDVQDTAEGRKLVVYRE